MRRGDGGETRRVVTRCGGRREQVSYNGKAQQRLKEDHGRFHSLVMRITIKIAIVPITRSACGSSQLMSPSLCVWKSSAVDRRLAARPSGAWPAVCQRQEMTRLDLPASGKTLANRCCCLSVPAACRRIGEEQHKLLWRRRSRCAPGAALAPQPGLRVRPGLRPAAKAAVGCEACLTLERAVLSATLCSRCGK